MVRPSWPGPDGVCSPMVTYEFQKYFGILWYEVEDGNAQNTVKCPEGPVMVSECHTGTLANVTVDVEGDMLAANPSTVTLRLSAQGVIWTNPADEAIGVPIPGIGR